MLEYNKNSLAFKHFASPEVIKFMELLEHPKVQSFLKLFFDNCLAISEMKVLNRLGNIEKALGMNDMADEEQETIPTKIQNLEEERLGSYCYLEV